MAEKASSNLSEAIEERDAALKSRDTARAEAQALEEKMEAMGVRLQAAEAGAETAAEQQQVDFLGATCNLELYCAVAEHIVRPSPSSMSKARSEVTGVSELRSKQGI